MKWDLVQGEIIKKIYSGSTRTFYYVDKHRGYVEVMLEHIIYRLPEFFCYVAFPPAMEWKNNELLINYFRSHETTELLPRRMEIKGKAKVQIFENVETGEEVQINTAFYSKFVEKADEVTFWGTDRKSPVFAINGPSPDDQNIIFMVLPIV